MTEEYKANEKPEESEQGTSVEQPSDEKVGIDDVGKGLILLAGILLLSYFALLFVTTVVQVEPGQGVWTMPSYMFGTVALSMVLIIIGLALLKVNAKRKRA